MPHDYENDHGRTVASDACCYGRCRRGSACRYDCLCVFLVVIIIIIAMHVRRAAVLKLKTEDQSLLPKTFVALRRPAYEVLAARPVTV